MLRDHEQPRLDVNDLFKGRHKEIDQSILATRWIYGANAWHKSPERHRGKDQVTFVITAHSGSGTAPSGECAGEAIFIKTCCLAKLMDRLDNTLPLGDVAEGARHPRINLRVILCNKFGAICGWILTEACRNHLVPPSRRHMPRCEHS